MPDMKEVFRLIRKMFLVYQARKWSKAARKAYLRGEFYAAEVAMSKFDELTEQI